MCSRTDTQSHQINAESTSVPSLWSHWVQGTRELESHSTHLPLEHHTHLQLLVNPIQEGGDAGIHPRLVHLSTANAKACGAHQLPQSPLLAHQGAPTVSLESKRRKRARGLSSYAGLVTQTSLFNCQWVTPRARLSPCTSRMDSDILKRWLLACVGRCPSCCVSLQIPNTKLGRSSVACVVHRAGRRRVWMRGN